MCADGPAGLTTALPLGQVVPTLVGTAARAYDARTIVRDFPVPLGDLFRELRRSTLMKRALLPITLLLALFAGSGSAAAAPPTPNDTSTEQFQCPDFVVDATATGSSKVTYWFGRPYPVSKPIPFYSATSSAAKVTFTSVTSTPKTVTYQLNGTKRAALQFDPFDIVYKSTGWNVMYVPPAYGTPGLFLSVGQVTWTLEGPAYPNGGMTGPGKITDICALLAP